MIFSTIHFSELTNFNDSNSIVVTGVKVYETDLVEMGNFFSNTLGFSTGKNLIGVYRILDNVLDDDGRTDWLLVFDNENIQFSPLKRLPVASWVKWTSDFIDNFAEDYASVA